MFDDRYQVYSEIVVASMLYNDIVDRDKLFANLFEQHSAVLFIYLFSCVCVCCLCCFVCILLGNSV